MKQGGATGVLAQAMARLRWRPSSAELLGIAAARFLRGKHAMEMPTESQSQSLPSSYTPRPPLSVRSPESHASAASSAPSSSSSSPLLSALPPSPRHAPLRLCSPFLPQLCPALFSPAIARGQHLCPAPPLLCFPASLSLSHTPSVAVKRGRGMIGGPNLAVRGKGLTGRVVAGLLCGNHGRMGARANFKRF